jgi:nitroreductase
MTGMAFSDVVRQRRSTRRFLPDPVPMDLLQASLEDALLTPSNCNTQPWIVHVVRGGKLNELSAALMAAETTGKITPDIPFIATDYTGIYGERLKNQGAHYYSALGIERSDTEGRVKARSYNLEFFGATTIILLFMPEFGGERKAADMGMFAQTLLLALTARGLASIPQAALGLHAATTRAVLGIPDEQKLLFGISVGYADPEWETRFQQIGRAPFDELVTYHE